MGLFGGKKVYVASTVQNMAGDELERPDYLKTTVVGNVLANRESIADTIANSYLKGPGMKLRSFFRWAAKDDNYAEIGMPSAKIGHSKNLNGSVIAGQIGLPSDKIATVQTVETGPADYSYWTEQYILENSAGEFDTNWESDINDQTGLVTITYEGGSIETFTPSNLNRNSQYVYATYLVSGPGSAEPMVEGDWIQLGTGDFPDMTGWELISQGTTYLDRDLIQYETTTATYSDGRPDEVSVVEVPFTESYPHYEGTFKKEVYNGTADDADEISKSLITRYLLEDRSVGMTTLSESSTDEDIGGGVIKTTHQKVERQILIVDRSYKDDTQRTVVTSWDGPYIFIYEVGTGNSTLDALVQEDEDFYEKEFFPFIPIRLENEFLSESYLPEAYELGKKALNKAVDGKIDKIIDELTELESLPDIDHAYAVFGVAVNVLENTGRMYLYDFFTQLASVQQTTISDYNAWKIAASNFQDSLTAWLDWKEDQENPLSSNYGEAEPTVAAYPATPESKLMLDTPDGVQPGYKVEIVWQGISETFGTGLAKIGAKEDELWFHVLETDSFQNEIYYDKSSINVLNKNIDHVRLYWQIDENNWKALDIVGMVHRNHIYKKKYVEITLKEGLDDGEDTGFIVPLHYPTLKNMTLKDATQLSTACTFLVFNSYVVKKSGLLGSIFFKIFLIVVIIAVVVFVPGLAPGVVKAAGVTGAALGFTGTTALIVGAAANAIAAMIITSVITDVAVEVFGERLGTIIGMVASFVAMNGFGNLTGGQGLTLNFGNMTSVTNIAQLTNAVGNVYSKFVYMDAMDTVKATQEMLQEFEDKSKEISKLYAEKFGYGNGIIDPLMLLDSTNTLVEYSDAFLSRTLMTGTDIARMSMEMPGAFADLTLSTDLMLN